MRLLILELTRQFIRDQRGVTLVEYGIALALALLLGVAALTTLGGEIAAALTSAGTQMPD